MHFVIGAAAVVASFVWALGFSEHRFDGFYNEPSAILLVGVPLGLALATHPFSVIGDAFRGLWWALTRDLAGEQRRTRRRLASLARELKQGRGQAAFDVLRGSKDAAFTMLAERVIRQAKPEDIALDGTALAREELSHYQLADKLFTSLGDSAPGVGMMATVIGLVQLLANMSDLSSLGPSMALGLLGTLYGLVLAHALYLPLARISASQGVRRANDLNLILTCLKKIAARHPIYEIEQLVGVRSETSPSADVRVPEAS
jgi:chemotaxis protein MotA